MSRLELLALVLYVNIVSSVSIYEHAADQCDWIGSGGGGRGVRPVYLRCSRGTVAWRYPHGALRVVLFPPVLTESLSNVHLRKISSDREEKANVIVNRKENATRNSDGTIFRISGFRTCTKISGSIRVYLEARGKLRLLYSPRDGKHKASHRCFHEKKQPAALYIEAEGTNDAELQYDLEVRYVDRSNNGTTYISNEEEEEDCRPCSTNELAQAYCQSDLVARGTVSAVQRRPNLEAAELILKVTKTLRQIEDNEINNDATASIASINRSNVRVRLPIACDARHGQGEFVIMAKRRLGDLVLVCAPRLETWTKVIRELETAPCVLQS